MERNGFEGWKIIGITEINTFSFAFAIAIKKCDEHNLIMSFRS
jgi:hypothetical protein